MTPPVKLEAEVVKVILEACVNETTLSELRYLLGHASLSYHILKKCLFFLIEYDLISYKGCDRVFVITKDGWDVLSKTTRSGINKIALE